MSPLPRIHLPHVSTFYFPFPFSAFHFVLPTYINTLTQSLFNTFTISSLNHSLSLEAPRKHHSLQIPLLLRVVTLEDWTARLFSVSPFLVFKTVFPHGNSLLHVFNPITLLLHSSTLRLLRGRCLAEVIGEI